MTDTDVRFAETLKKQGHSLTHARHEVFKALENKEPMTMHDLIKGLPSIDRASIYRTIALFEKLGIVQRLQIGWKYKLELADTFNYHHHHLSCRRCGSIISLREDSMLEANLNSLAAEYGYRDLSHQLEVTGICKNCQE